jgi:hypothetical protein
MSISDAIRARWTGPGPAAAASSRALDPARQAFVDAVADLGVAEARQLQLKARLAVSIQDLWHLRPGVFELVAQIHTEGEAWHRLARLNHHFPTRSLRSGFGAFDPLR